MISLCYILTELDILKGESLLTEKLKFSEIFVNILKTIFFLSLSILPTFLLSLASFSAGNLSRGENWLIAMVVLGITLALIYYVFSYYLHHSKNQIKKIGWKDLGIAFSLFVFLRVSVVVNAVINEYINGNSISSNDLALEEFGATVLGFPMYLLLFNFIISIAGPILEEIIYRGIFIDIWFDSVRNYKAGIISSTIFALAHGFDDLITFSIYLLMAFVFYYAYYRRGNILDAILVHIFNNALVILASYILI